MHPTAAETVHWFGNAGPGTAHARVAVRPALRMEELFETQEAMAVEDRLPGTRLPRPTDLALLLSEFEQGAGRALRPTIRAQGASRAAGVGGATARQPLPVLAGRGPPAPPEYWMLRERSGDASYLGAFRRVLEES